MLVLFFSNGTKRYVHFSTVESYYEDGQRVKKRLGKGWKLTGIDAAVQIGGIMYESTRIEEQECKLSQIETLDKDRKKVFDLYLKYRQHD